MKRERERAGERESGRAGARESWRAGERETRSNPSFPSLSRSLAPSLPRSLLDVQVLHVERVVFDEPSARLDLVAHQDGEDFVGLDRVVNPDLEEGAFFG